MNALRRTRRFGRLLAAWLLLSFIVMTGVPMGSMAATQSIADDVCVQAPSPHAGHGDGSPSHCPLCMHAAAPPPAFAQRVAAEAPVAPAAASPRSVVKVRVDAPPPGRGPPAIS